MAHSLATATPIPTKSSKSKRTTTLGVGSLAGVRACQCHGDGDPNPFSNNKLVLPTRRAVTLGLAGALMMGFNVGGWSANAASRRPPPPPPEEKKDPNLSGLRAKVLASKKRKEAMKENMARLREKGKPISQPSQ